MPLQRSQSTLILPITPCLIEVARELGKVRHGGHRHCRKTWEDRGPRGNFRADAYGVLSEIVFYDAAERVGVTPEGYVLISNPPPVGPDCTIAGVRCQLKSSLPVMKPYQRRQYFCYPEHQRLNPAQAAEVTIPLVFETPRRLAVYAPVWMESVGGWMLRNDGHTPYRSIDVRYLEPLEDLAALPGLLTRRTV